MRKVVAITGGNRGIGKAIAELFSENDFAVAVSSRSPRNPKLAPSIQHYSVDVRKREEVLDFVTRVRETLGDLNVFINCAGVSRWRPIDKIDPTFVSDIIETNLLGTLWGCQAAAEILTEGGSIINISSLAGKRGSANNSVYCASKFAINGITQSLAKELGTKGIRVNAVCPVYVETETILKSLEEKDSPAKGESVEKYLKDFTQSQTALGRLPKAQDVAELVFFLSSSKAKAITGQCINIDCGVLPQ